VVLISIGVFTLKHSANSSIYTLSLHAALPISRWDILSRILPLKTDAGSGALEQMVLGEYCTRHFTEHVPELTRALRAKLDTLMRSEEHTSELQSRGHLVCRPLLETKNKTEGAL